VLTGLSSGNNLLQNEGSTMVSNTLSPYLLMVADSREVNASSALCPVEDAIFLENSGEASSLQDFDVANFLDACDA
jgi:hypothetical protein